MKSYAVLKSTIDNLEDGYNITIIAIKSLTTNYKPNSMYICMSIVKETMLPSAAESYTSNSQSHFTL